MKHPAKYTDSFLPVFAERLIGMNYVLDPFAGTGKLAKIKEHGFTGEVFCNEIEKEWAESSIYEVDYWTIADAEKLPYSKDYFDAICTSPTYGNRMADHFEAKDRSHRITYRHYLGKPLNYENTGRMQWGLKYRKKHKACYVEFYRVLKLNGLFLCNISDHIRKGEIVPVVSWTKDAIQEAGFTLVETIEIKTPRMKYGANRKRVESEFILVFIKEKAKGER